MNATATTIPLGSSAKEIRELVASGMASKQAAIDYLSSRPKLRKPSAELLAELTGTEVKPGKRKPRDTTPNPKPEQAAGPEDRLHPTDWRQSVIHGKSGKPLWGAALKRAWEARISQANVDPEPNTTARDKATGGAKPDPKPSSQRNRIDVLVNLGEAIAELGREYKAICDAERH